MYVCPYQVFYGLSLRQNIYCHNDHHRTLPFVYRWRSPVIISYIHGCHPTCLYSLHVLLVFMITWGNMPFVFNVPWATWSFVYDRGTRSTDLEMLEKLFAIYFASTFYRWNIEFHARVFVLTSFIQSSQWTPYYSEITLITIYLKKVIYATDIYSPGYITPTKSLQHRAK